MDLILEQFKMITRDEWDGDKKSYSLAMIRYSQDDDLGQLHQYLTGHGELEGITDGPHPWRDGGLRLFMSHLAIHQAEVGKIADRLALYGVDGFMAHTSIEPSAEWQDVIESAERLV
jgi:hypothetical protein